ncbi:unnamed protein product, partial [Mesorhabditis spiculigera]
MKCESLVGALVLLCTVEAFFLSHRTIKPDDKPHTPNYIRLRKNDAFLACTTDSLQNECGPNGVDCVKDACTRCAVHISDPYSYCMRVTSCVCSLTRDPDCFKIVDECY